MNRLGSEEQQRTKHTYQGAVGWDDELVKRFNKLLRDTDAHWVLSSSWRHAEKWRLDMFQMGMDVKRLVDRTPHLPGEIRGKEIDEWLKKHANVERYAIIDDDSDMLPWQGRHFFKTDFDKGLTAEVAERVRIHLLGQDIMMLDDNMMKYCTFCYNQFPADELKSCFCMIFGIRHHHIVTKNGLKDFDQEDLVCKNCDGILHKHEKGEMWI
jgi:hypothetical protein